MVLVLVFLASLIPAGILYLWLYKLKEMPEGYADRCKKAVIAGFISVFPVILVSFIFNIIGNLLNFKETHPILYQAYYKFIVLALAEELVKFFTMRKIIKGRQYSWLEVTIYMILVALGFQVVEAIPYAIGSGIPHMLVRGLTLMHVGYGFITGYFQGKAHYTGNKFLVVIGIVISWLLHGLYDFGLSEELLASNDNFAFISVSLALLAIVLLIIMIVFIRKARKDSKYTTVK